MSDDVLISTVERLEDYTHQATLHTEGKVEKPLKEFARGTVLVRTLRHISREQNECIASPLKPNLTTTIQVKYSTADDACGEGKVTWEGQPDIY
jgi:hypothetical protein